MGEWLGLRYITLVILVMWFVTLHLGADRSVAFGK